MIKPRIKLIAWGNWECSGGDITRFARTVAQAYQRWYLASHSALTASIASPTQEGWPKKLEAQAPEELRSARAKRTYAPGRPLTVKTSTVAACPIEQPAYPSSAVRQIPGTACRKEYVPPKGLRINAARAAQIQPPLTTPHGIGTITRSWGGKESE